jgi:hypothetical protein
MVVVPMTSRRAIRDFLWCRLPVSQKSWIEVRIRYGLLSRTRFERLSSTPPSEISFQTNHIRSGHKLKTPGLRTARHCSVRCMP